MWPLAILGSKSSVRPYSVSFSFTALILAASTQNKKHVVKHKEQSSAESRLGNRSPTAANCLKKIYFSGGAAVTASTWSGDDDEGAGSRNVRQLPEADEQTR